MSKSTAIMKSMNALIRVPELSSTMRKMGEEMAKAGIIEEMMGEAMDSVEPEGLDAEADEVTEAVLFEITQGLMGTAPTAAKGGLPTSTKVASGAGATAAPVQKVAVAAGGGDGMDSLRDRLDKL
jgi:division protein CdvB (Snf7/Vps24/ESCRT-III family)